MYEKKEIKYIKAITPIHAGSGQDMGIVDMPIQREKHSNIPKIEASSLKGSIKSWIYRKINIKEGTKEELEELYEVFGPKDNGEDKASRISLTDARLLFFPMKSNEDIFKLVTCPYILKRWCEDMKFENEHYENNYINDISVVEGMCICNKDNKDKNVFLEEYIFEKAEDKKDIFNKLAEELKKKIDIDTNKIVIIKDEEFIDLVSMYTEVITRNKINYDTGVAEGTGLFTEEYLPSESILYFMILSSPKFEAGNGKSSDQVIQYFNKSLDSIFQVGGNSTIGKGFVKILKGKKA